MDVTGWCRRGRRLGVPERGQGLALLGVLVLAACGSTGRRPLGPVEDALVDPQPSRRLAAVVEVRRTRDLETAGELIEMLDDPDPGVRLAAGVTLRELTGRDTGYTPWAEPPERRVQVKNWRRWWREHATGDPVEEGAPAAVRTALPGRPSPPPPPAVRPSARSPRPAAPRRLPPPRVWVP